MGWSDAADGSGDMNSTGPGGRRRSRTGTQSGAQRRSGVRSRTVVAMTRSSPLIDRASELAVGRRALQVAATSVAHVLYVGGPGSGKSALLDALATSEEAEDALVLRAGGTQAETELDFAGLSQLLRPALSDTLDLPVEHQRVLDRVLRVGTPVHRADPPTAMAVLALLELLSRAQQLVLVVDDLQWVDRHTIDVLSFVARRAAGLRMATLMATRELSVIPAPGTAVVEISPLSAVDARTLLHREAAGLDPGLREAILHNAQGNPLALVELPHAAGSAPSRPMVTDTVPVTSRIQESFASRLDDLSDGARTLLLLAACLESGELAELASAARTAGIDLAELDAAEDSNLLRIDGQLVRFTHPLIASIVVAQATPGELRQAHALLAGVLARQPERALRHRAAAATVADETLAAELESAVAALSAPGPSPAMAATLERAAFLSVKPAAKARRLASAADAWRAVGRYDAAEALLARIDPAVADDRTRLSVESQRGWHQFDTGDVDAALATLVSVLERSGELGRRETVRPAGIAAVARWLSGNRAHDAALRRLVRPLDVAIDDSTPAMVVMALAAADATENPAGVLAALEWPATRTSAQGGSELRTVATADTRAWELARLADAALMVDAVEAAQALGRWASDQLRTVGSFGALATALGTYCHAEFALGNWAVAAEIAGEVLDIAAVTGQRRQAAFVSANLAFIAVAQGRADEAQRRRQEAVGWALPRHHRLILGLAAWSHVLEALSAGETDVAVQTINAMRAVSRRPGELDVLAPDGELLVASACADVVEALGRAGRLDEAAVVSRWADARTRRWPARPLGAQAPRARAWLPA